MLSTPKGYRLKVQLVDATSEAEARKWLWEMYGYVHGAVFVSGTMRCKVLKGEWKPSPDGWRVFVREGQQ